jgi:hypothetical protein
VPYPQPAYARLQAASCKSLRSNGLLAAAIAKCTRMHKAMEMPLPSNGLLVDALGRPNVAVKGCDHKSAIALLDVGKGFCLVAEILSHSFVSVGSDKRRLSTSTMRSAS